MNGRGRLAGMVLAGVILAGAVGWFAGTQIRSPAEVASRTAAPAAAPILVPAEERVLSTDIVTRGTARFGSPQQLSLASSGLKTRAGVAARLPVAGKELKEGDVIFTTSGRPVFLLTGAQPAFRDLGPGIDGEDVLQLEASARAPGITTPAPSTASTTLLPATPSPTGTRARASLHSQRPPNNWRRFVPSRQMATARRSTSSAPATRS